ncbi:hypothetical protein ACC677_37125, partial [Rhizobium ruizarguesonis]
YSGTRAVSTHQYISRREASILKARGDRPVRVTCVTFKRLPKEHVVFKSLEQRAKIIESEIRRIDGVLREAQAVPRIFLLEMEYLRALHA